MDEPGIHELERIRELWAHAETTGNLSFFESFLADDAVIMAPGRAAFEGKTACMGFIQEVLADLRREFDREITLTSREIQIQGEWAFDRGTFSQHLVRKDSGEALHESGKYFWLYRREADGWKVARIVGNYDWQDDDENGEVEGQYPVRGPDNVA